MNNASTSFRTQGINPTNLRKGDKFQPMFNDNVYTCKSDFDPNTHGLFLEGIDYEGHCTFFDCNTVRLIIEDTPENNTPENNTPENMNHFTFFQSAIEFAAKRGGVNPTIFSSGDIARLLGQINDMGYCNVAGQKITQEAQRLFAVHAPKTEQEPMTFEEELNFIAGAIGEKYNVTTLEWHVLNYIIEVDHGNGMGPDTKELRNELKMEGQQLGGVLTSLQNKGLVDISDSSRMIGISYDITHPADALKQWMYETHKIAIGNY